MTRTKGTTMSTIRTGPARPFGGLRAASIALGCTVGLLVAACGSPPSSGDGGGREASGEKAPIADCPLDALDEASGTVNVDLWYGGLGGSPDAVLQDMAKRFNASQDKVVVKANSQGASYEEMLRKYEGASATPAQLPQIAYVEDTALGEMVDKGQVLPAQACMEADGYDAKQIEAVARTSFSVDGVLQPGYMNVSTPVLYYNKVHFKKAGLDPEKPPTTFAELREVSEALKKAGVSKQPLAFKADAWFFSTWLSGLGQEVVNNDNGRSAPPTEATFNTPEAVAMLEDLQSMHEDGLISTFPVTEGSINHYLALLQEDSSMLIETSTATSTIRDFLGGELDAEAAGVGFDTSDLDLDITKLVPAAGPLPGPEAGGKVYASGGAFFMLNTSSPAQQAASWEFMKFMLQADNALAWHTEAGYLPVVKEVLDDPAVETFWETDVAGVMLKNAVDQLNDADPDQAGPLMGPFAQYKDAINAMLFEVVGDGNADPAGALAAAETKVNGILTDYNGG